MTMKKRISKIMRSGFAVLLSAAMIAGTAVAPAYAAPDRERPTQEEVEADIKELYFSRDQAVERRFGGV